MKNIIPNFVSQEETNECGLACIAMLAQTQGLNVSLETLREVYPASDHGTSLIDLSSILANYGIATTPVLFEHQELNSLPLPLFYITEQAILCCLLIAREITCV